MKHTPYMLLSTVVLLSSCTTVHIPNNTSLQQRLHNPLFAERFSEDLNERLVAIQINDPSIQANTELNSQIEAIKQKWQTVAKEASQKRFDGNFAPLNSLDNLEYTRGSVLLYENTLFFSSDFDVNAIDTIELYLSPISDPRSSTFPTAEDIAIGNLESPYGAQSYYLATTPENVRSIVLYDPLLQKIVSFGVFR